MMTTLIASSLCVMSIRGISHLMLLHHQQYLFDVIKKHIKDAQYISIAQSRSVTLSLNQNKQLTRCIDSTCTDLPIDIRYHIELNYRGFPQHRIQFDKNGLLVGNGHFTMTHPRLDDTHWILNHHARLRRAPGHEIH